MTLKACLICLKPTKNSRCEIHELPKPLRKNFGSRKQSHSERKAKEQAKKQWIATYGYLCAGYKRDPHPAKDLTVDHYKAKVLGGNPLGPFIILCRSCNSRKGNHEQQLKNGYGTFKTYESSNDNY